jgi:Ca-activated chloride channel homolog
MIAQLLKYDWAYPWQFLWFLPLMYLIWKSFKTKSNHDTTIKMSHIGGRLAHQSIKSRMMPFLISLLYLATSCIIIALARPRWPLVDEQIKGQGIDIVVAIDVSLSMLSRDFKPNRLEVTKKMAVDFVSRRPQDRIGLVIFSGESFSQCPITFDHQVLTTFIDDIQPGVLKDGTAIGMGLASAVNRLKDSESTSKIIILLTDGVNNSGSIEPNTAAELAKEYGIKVYTIGVGSTGVAETFAGVDIDGEIMYQHAQVEIDEALLDKIATDTNGKYYRAVDEASLKNIYAEIDRLEKTDLDTHVTKQYKDKFRPWLIAAFVLTAMWWLLTVTYFRNNVEY